MQSQGNSKDILDAPGRSENSEDEPFESVEFYCSDCEYFTVTWANLKRHRVGHEREEKFKCHYCNFSARMKNKLSFHLNHYHCNPPLASLEASCTIQNAKVENG